MLSFVFTSLVFFSATQGKLAVLMSLVIVSLNICADIAVDGNIRAVVRSLSHAERPLQDGPLRSSRKRILHMRPRARLSV